MRNGIRETLGILGIVFLLGGTAVVAGAAIDTGDSPLFSLNTANLSPVKEDGSLPQAHSLGTCYPNPFNPSTTISFSLAHSAVISLAVYDVTGRLIRRLIVAETMPPGHHEAVWNGRDERDRNIAAGVYFYRLHAGDFVATQRATLIK